ncbi:MULTISPECIES: branched-chain amino acid ABC transporter permease [unclassified Chelatococcus]|uniref:branched-chain amino acid ABC transporter permease n=1 Tax=unclassified Chelatococcus TaxID=2638111 RepID=UPI001BCF59E4|nr:MULTISPECIES: branched-chain amino acid ABC transporter permease [unclassified Chelatococcus]MBS7700727.1 branched-chain amino acid ABC transporter permease [Chelatococcus sp. YT9]MBX3559311.1 branched-chain amino acid ABC transporter permease [Chelatococcus sp.]
MRSLKLLALVATIIVAALIPVLLPDQPYIVNTLTLTLCAIIPAIGLNLLYGQAGLLSLGHMAFTGVGGYTAALLMKNAGWALPEAMLAAAIVAGFVGLLVGIPCLRLRSHFFVIVTLGVGMILYTFFNNLDGITGGAQGLPGVPRPRPLSIGDLTIEFRTPRGFYWLALLTMLGTLFVQWLIARSPFGFSLAAIRQDETMAASRGVDVFAHKLAVFVISSAIAGVGGALSVTFLRVAAPTMFDLHASMNVVAIVLVGGPGYLAGPILGAFIFIALPEFLRVAAEFRLIVFGFVLVFIALFANRGLLGLADSFWSRMKRDRMADEVPGATRTVKSEG